MFLGREELKRCGGFSPEAPSGPTLERDGSFKQGAVGFEPPAGGGKEKHISRRRHFTKGGWKAPHTCVVREKSFMFPRGVFSRKNKYR